MKSGNKVLVLGAGPVSRPLIRYLFEKTDLEVICASRSTEKAAGLVRGCLRGKALPLDLADRVDLEKLIKSCDLVVSLIPYRYHGPIAELCIRHGKHLVTTSYVGETMRELDGRARDAGIMIMNEIGLVPGIDHMESLRLIRRVEAKGGNVTSFRSYAGGLPAPEAGMNPIGHRFSWNPQEVLLAGRVSARYLENGRIVEVPGSEVFNDQRMIRIPEMGLFEAYPNRNALQYREIYGLQNAKTVFRGTLRNPGWCRFWYKMARLGWFNDAARTDLEGRTWARIMRSMVPGNGDLVADLCAHWNIARDDDEIRRAEWLGLLGNERVPAGRNNLLDLLCVPLRQKLEYKAHERDMILLHHVVMAEYPDKTERITATLAHYGTPNGDAAIYRAIGLPLAILVKMFFEGEFPRLTGVVLPTIPEIYNPILDELEAFGIKSDERVESAEAV